MSDEKTRISFAKAVEILTKLGIEFSQTEEWRPKDPPHKPYPLPFFKEIQLPFTPGEWCELMMRDGDYNNNDCCDTCSNAWHILQAIFYESGGRMTMKKLVEVAMLMMNHEKVLDPSDYGGSVILDAAVENWPNLDPWDKLCVLWHLTKDSYAPDLPHGPHPDDHPAENAAYVLEKGLFALSLDRMFTPEKTPNSQKQTRRLMALYRILPPLRTLYDRIGELGPGPMDGYALVDKERGDQVAANGFGLCVYQTRAEAEALLVTWRADDAAHEVEVDRKPIDERIGIRPVRVSMEKGIEFLNVEKSP